MSAKKAEVERVKTLLKDQPVEPLQISDFLEEGGHATVSEKTRAAKILLRPGIGIKDLVSALPELAGKLDGLDGLVLEQAEIQLKYDVYIEKERELVKMMSSLEDLMIPESFNYDKLHALSTEARQKLGKIKPRTLGQASRISGVNPSDVQILMVFMGR
jgi:tRNA uridine 5-carboxymethylaminomethyl modification enzyme